jgi:hypothetical protein
MPLLDKPPEDGFMIAKLRLSCRLVGVYYVGGLDLIDQDGNHVGDPMGRRGAAPRTKKSSAISSL